MSELPFKTNGQLQDAIIENKKRIEALKQWRLDKIALDASIEIRIERKIERLEQRHEQDIELMIKTFKTLKTQLGGETSESDSMVHLVDHQSGRFESLISGKTPESDDSTPPDVYVDPIDKGISPRPTYVSTEAHNKEIKRLIAEFLDKISFVLVKDNKDLREFLTFLYQEYEERVK